MFVVLFFFKQKTAYEMRISDWSSDVCSSDLGEAAVAQQLLVETARRDAQVGAFEIGFGKAGEARKLTADLRAFLALQFLALEQRGGDRKSTRLNSSH